MNNERLDKQNDSTFSIQFFCINVISWQELLDLDIATGPASHDVLLKEMRKIIKYSVKTGKFFL